jgi:hypothetical protein
MRKPQIRANARYVASSTWACMGRKLRANDREARGRRCARNEREVTRPAQGKARQIRSEFFL